MYNSSCPKAKVAASKTSSEAILQTANAFMSPKSSFLGVPSIIFWYNSLAREKLCVACRNSPYDKATLPALPNSNYYAKDFYSQLATDKLKDPYHSNPHYLGIL